MAQEQKIEITAEQLEKFRKQEEELNRYHHAERVKAGQQKVIQIPTNEGSLMATLNKERAEYNMSEDFKNKYVLADCKKELSEYFLHLDPRHSNKTFGKAKAKFGQVFGNVKKAVEESLLRHTRICILG